MTLTIDPRITLLISRGVVSYTASFTINQAAMDGGDFVSNVASVTGIFTTPSGITGTVTTVSDDPTTPADDDPTVTDLDNESGIEVTKTFTTTDKNGNGLKDVGDIINYTIAIENKGQTSLWEFYPHGYFPQV